MRAGHLEYSQLGAINLRPQTALDCPAACNALRFSLQKRVRNFRNFLIAVKAVRG